MLNSKVTLKSIPLGELMPDPNQPRKLFDEQEINQLGASLLQRQIVPIIVVFVALQNKYVIVDGERRFRAATKANISVLNAIVLEQMPSEGELLEVQLTVNCQRQDLNPLDRLAAYKRLMLLRNWNATELAKAISVSKATVSKILSLDRLPEEDKSKISNGEVGLVSGYAKAKGSEAVRKAADIAPVTNRIVCRFSEFSISLAAKSILNVADIAGACEQLIKECRKAIKDGLDVSTFVDVLRDRAKSSPNQSGA